MGLFYGIKDYLQQNRANERQRKQTSQDIASGAGLPPLPSRGMELEQGQIVKRVKWLFVIVLLAPAAFVPLLLSGEEIPWRISLMFIVLTFTVLAFVWPFYRLSQYKLQAYEDRIVASDNNNRSFSAAWSEVLWTQNHIKISQLVVPLGNSHQTFTVSRQDIIKIIIPRLLANNCVSQMAMMKYQWASPDNLLKLVTVAITLMLVALVALERVA